MSPLVDAVTRASFCIVVEGIGFWYPIWVERQLGTTDSRIGLIYIWSLPIIFAYVFYSTIFILRDFRQMSDYQWFRRLVILPLIGCLIWHPFVLVAIHLLRVWYWDITRTLAH